MKRLSFSIILILLIIAASNAPHAKVTGICSNCHTMHNSQGGQSMAFQVNAALTGYESDESPNPQLLLSNCVGCHSSTGSATIEDGVPIVFNMIEPVNPLAGGNFYWVTTDDAKGHNVFLNEGDGNLSVAPGDSGFSTCGTNGCHANLHLPVSGASGLEGRYGCNGCHLNVMHHADDSATVVNATGGWYRFLSGHMSGDGCGVEGIEDSDWQATKGASDHNEYSGCQWDGGYGFGGFGNTMTAYCTGCHGVFHSDQGSESPWLRHPSDAVIKNEGEYANAFGAAGSGTGIYDPLVPVARPSLSAVSDTVAIGTDLVMCLSCHRAHGSPYYKMMRWDNKANMSGCVVCHTSKN